MVAGNFSIHSLIIFKRLINYHIEVFLGIELLGSSYIVVMQLENNKTSISSFNQGVGGNRPFRPLLVVTSSTLGSG